MRIAIVGKWWSWKTTISALLTSYFTQIQIKPLVVDADLNIHLPALLMPSEKFPWEKYLSTAANVEQIKTYLKGKNERITSLASFRKTTPPTSKSQLFVLKNHRHYLYQFAEDLGNLFLMVVGSYHGNEIGASCYHNNLAILENLLSHMDDQDSVVIVDMVAGVDAFASSLHAQFDMLLLVVEPTKKWIEVRNQYDQLSKQAGIDHQLFVVGNKCFDKNDQDFLSFALPKEKLLGTIGISHYLRALEKNGNQIDFSLLEPEFQALFPRIVEQLQKQEQALDVRLEKLYALHRKYVAQSFIQERFWDLTGQIDESFSFHTSQ